jgi:hypothetical protein
VQDRTEEQQCPERPLRAGRMTGWNETIIRHSFFLATT